MKPVACWSREIPGSQPDGDPLPESGLQCRYGRAGRHPAVLAGRRDPALLPDARGAGRPERLCREAKTGLLELPALPVVIAHCCQKCPHHPSRLGRHGGGSAPRYARAVVRRHVLDICRGCGRRWPRPPASLRPHWAARGRIGILATNRPGFVFAVPRGRSASARHLFR